MSVERSTKIFRFFEIVAFQVFVLTVLAREDRLSVLLESLIEERLVNSLLASKRIESVHFQLKFAPALYLLLRYDGEQAQTMKK